MKMTKESKRQLNQQHKDDKIRFKKIEGIMVVSAKHMHHYWHRHKPMGLFATHHVYSWRVTNRTHNLKWVKIGHFAKVVDKQGKAKNTVVITHINDVTGSVAKKMAMKLEPVIIFENRILKNGQIINDKE